MFLHIFLLPLSITTDSFVAPGKDCESSPCLDGGTCTDLAPSGFTCDCRNGYVGDTCEIGACLYWFLI